MAPSVVQVRYRQTAILSHQERSVSPGSSENTGPVQVSASNLIYSPAGFIWQPAWLVFATWEPQMWYGWVSQTHKWPPGLHHDNRITSVGDTYHVAVFLLKLFGGVGGRWHEKTQLNSEGGTNDDAKGSLKCPGPALTLALMHWDWTVKEACFGGKLELEGEKDGNVR